MIRHDSMLATDVVENSPLVPVSYAAILRRLIRHLEPDNGVEVAEVAAAVAAF